MKGILKTIVWIGFAAATAYAGYSWYTYSGLYRLIAEWQLETFGSFSLKLTLLGVILALIVPVAILGRLLGGPNLMNKPDGLAQAQSSPRLTALLGLPLLAAGAGAGWLGYQKSQETIAYESIDLAAGQLPSTQHVVLTGIARTEYLMQYETKSSGSSTIHTYFPLTSSSWRRGEPFVYFLKTNATAYLPEGGGRMFAFSRTTPPFKMTTQKALLVRNGLPGPVGEFLSQEQHCDGGSADRARREPGRRLRNLHNCRHCMCAWRLLHTVCKRHDGRSTATRGGDVNGVGNLSASCRVRISRLRLTSKVRTCHLGLPADLARQRPHAVYGRISSP